MQKRIHITHTKRFPEIGEPWDEYKLIAPNGQFMCVCHTAQMAARICALLSFGPAVSLGRIKSPAKAKSSRANGKLGGRPKNPARGAKGANRTATKL